MQRTEAWYPYRQRRGKLKLTASEALRQPGRSACGRPAPSPFLLPYIHRAAPQHLLLHARSLWKAKMAKEQVDAGNVRQDGEDR